MTEKFDQFISGVFTGLVETNESPPNPTRMAGTAHNQKSIAARKMPSFLPGASSKEQKEAGELVKQEDKYMRGPGLKKANKKFAANLKKLKAGKA